jgi:hypothetical protein
MVFRNGKFIRNGRTIVILEMNFFQGAVTADVGTSTDDAELVVEDVLNAASSFLTVTDPRGLYISQVELQLDVSLESASPIIGWIGGRLSEVVGRYESGGQSPDSAVPAFLTTSLVLNPDPNQYAVTSDFRIERRANRPYPENVYFSQAPLRTSDHVALLGEFEDALRSVDRADALKR